MIKYRAALIKRVVIIVLVVSLAPALSKPALADDHSYGAIVSHLKRNYNAHNQGFLGLINFARFMVKVIQPAGVKNFKVTMLRDVDYTRGPHPESPDFHSFVRSTIDPNWEPLIQFISRKEKQWAYVYSTREKDDVKILVVAMQEHDAFVLQFKLNPAKLAEFVNDPRVMGISLSKDGDANATCVKKDADGSDQPKTPN